MKRYDNKAQVRKAAIEGLTHLAEVGSVQPQISLLDHGSRSHPVEPGSPQILSGAGLQTLLATTSLGIGEKARIICLNLLPKQAPNRTSRSKCYIPLRQGDRVRQKQIQDGWAFGDAVDENDMILRSEVVVIHHRTHKC